MLLAVGALALGGAALALRLEPSAATDTLVNRSSRTFEDTERFKRDFGDEAVVVLVKGDLRRTVLTDDLGRLLRLEGCLSGNVPASQLPRQLALNRQNPAAGLPPVCRQIAEMKPAKVVYGPGTFVNTAAARIGDEFARRQQATAREADRAAAAARRASARRGDPPAEQRRLAKIAGGAVQAKFVQETLTLALRYGLTDIPRIDSPDFVSQLVFDTRVRHPKSKFAYLFPSDNAALIQVRLKPGLSDSERERAVDLFEQAVGSRAFAPRHGASYVVTGVPVVVQGLADAVQRSIFVLLVAALLVMAATLALVFRSRLRLLPLAIALAAAALTFGALELAGGSLTMASIAVLPVLIGLAVDYAIQFQARFDERRAERPEERFGESAEAAARAGGPTIATAGLATAVGFIVLLLSPVPMVRGFGVLLVFGIALALGCALTAGFAALVRFRGSAPQAPAFATRARRRAAAWPVWERLAFRGWRALDVALTRPRRVLAVGLAIAVVGWAVDTQSRVESDVTKLVPQDLGALKDVRELQRETGVSGEIDVTVRADDITRPDVIAWMTRFQAGALEAHGYKPGESCSQRRSPPELCPAFSLTDIFSSVNARDQRAVRSLLDAVPAYFSQGVVSRDRRTANLAFGIRLMPLDRQKQVVDDLKRRLDPPAGVSASVVGLPVLAAEANGALSSPWRRALTLIAALAGVFLVLLALRRSTRAAAVPLIPIALATGWSGGLLFSLGVLPWPNVDLNPMTVTLGALVIAISTEFSVLLSNRYQEERDRGASPSRAIELTYASTGAAVLASGATAIAGFAALAFSDIKMLRDFGVVTVIDLTVSLLGVMLVLPAALLWAEEHGRFTARDLDPRRWGPSLGRELWEARPALPSARRQADIS